MFEQAYVVNKTTILKKVHQIDQLSISQQVEAIPGFLSQIKPFVQKTSQKIAKRDQHFSLQSRISHTFLFIGTLISFSVGQGYGWTMLGIWAIFFFLERRFKHLTSFSQDQKLASLLLLNQETTNWHLIKESLAYLLTNEKKVSFLLVMKMNIAPVIVALVATGLVSGLPNSPWHIFVKGYGEIGFLLVCWQLGQLVLAIAKLIFSKQETSNE